MANPGELAEDEAQPGGILARLQQPIITHARWPWVVALAALLLTLPSVGSGLSFDDYHAKIFFLRPDSPARLMPSALDLFSFFRSPDQLAQLRDMGAPWWTSGHIRAGFWRPLASATHCLDYALWPHSPSLMHLHSVLWYAATAAMVAVLYRRLMGPTVAAGLAALLYAIDDTHGNVAGFVCNRSDLPALLCGALCLLAHHRWRREGRWPWAVAAPISLLLSLLFKEAGIATCAYLAAYELSLRKDPWPQRLLALAPYAAVVLAWRLVWSGLGYGIVGVPLYVDPLTEPLRFAREFIERAPLLLLAQWTFAPCEVSSALARGLPAVWWAAVACLTVIAFILAPLLRQDRTARFWATGMLLSVLPACAAFPMDRMLVWIGIGTMALAAQFLVRVGDAIRGPADDAFRRSPARVLGWLLVAAHLIIAPLIMPIRAAWFMGPPGLLDQLRPAEPMDPSITGQTLIVVNPPEALVLMESVLKWSADGQPLPRRLRALTSSRLQPVEVQRLDEQTLTLRPKAGFLNGLADPLVRGPDRPLAVGQRIELSGMTVEITQLGPDQRPTEALFRFHVPLEDKSLRWLQWRDGRFETFIPPPVGRKVRLPGGRFGLHGFRAQGRQAQE
ncbi:MAG TPA: hypothetical protein PKY77_12680 [Phycisphaerae bacterium]|nr:hypothetical protein [Phycisphaerae bacterium]HRY69184.1 hypothetical protein [Phycisphaerae bacterium]HSA26145.1 hypothetical protein [Phycisphaerae bacterium]